MSLVKRYNGPELESATGPSFVQSHTISVDIANGQTVDSFTISDFLPDNAQYIQTT